MTIKKYRTPKYYEEKAEQYGYKYNLKSGAQKRGMDDEIDAFRHAYMQAHMTLEYGKDVAKVIGDVYEKWGDYTESQNAKQRNMDLWNNSIGRQIGEEVKNETSHFRNLTTQKMYEDMIADKINQRIKNGDMITEPKTDKRRYEEGKPTGGAAPVEPFSRQQIAAMTPEEFRKNESLIDEQMAKGVIMDESGAYQNIEIEYTREDIAKMSPKEYEKHEDKIMRQANSVGIPSKNQLPKGKKSGYSKKQSSSGESSDGKWVTINGNHVLIKD